MKYTRLILTWIFTIGVAMVFITPQSATAQPPHKKKHHGHMNALKRHLYPPEQIIKHAETLGLTDAQLKTIGNAMKRTSNKSIDLRLALRKETTKLNKMVAETDTNGGKTTQKILLQADKVMQIESKLKRTRLELMLAVKAALSKDQIAKIKEYQKKRRQHRRPPHPHWGKKKRGGPF